MAKSAHTFLLFALLCAAGAPLCAQQSAPSVKPAVMGKGIGKLVIDGTPSQTTTTIFVTNEVVVDPNTHANVISHGNTLVFAPNSDFQAMVNAYRLNRGGSRVATYTGMTAHLPNCFSVTPVRPDYMTLFEVNWANQSAY